MLYYTWVLTPNDLIAFIANSWNRSLRSGSILSKIHTRYISVVKNLRYRCIFRADSVPQWHQNSIRSLLVYLYQTGQYEYKALWYSCNNVELTLQFWNVVVQIHKIWFQFRFRKKIPLFIYLFIFFLLPVYACNFSDTKATFIIYIKRVQLYTTTIL